MHSPIRFLGVVAAVGAASLGSAAVSFFYDVNDAGFNSVAVLEDYESVFPKDATLFGLSSNGLSYTPLPPSSAPTTNLVVASPGYTNFGIAGPTTSSILTASGEEHFRIDLNAHVARRFGLDTYTINAAGEQNSVAGAPPVKVTVVTTGGTVVLDLPAPAGNKGFLGIVSDDAITSVTWLGVMGGIRNTGIDNIRVSDAVPEPASMAILGLGLAALARKRRA